MELVIDRGVKSYDVKDVDGTLLGVIKINPADIGISGRFVSARNAIAELAEQAKPFCNPLCYRCHRSFGIFPIAAKDAKIVGITHDEHFFQPGSAHHHIAFAFINDFRCADYSPIRMTDGQRMFHPLTIYPMVKFIQDHICQQRRYDSALRCSFCGIFRCSVRHTDRGF